MTEDDGGYALESGDWKLARGKPKHYRLSHLDYKDEYGGFRYSSNDFVVRCNKHPEGRVQASRYVNGVGFYCMHRKGKSQCKCGAFLLFGDLLHAGNEVRLT